MKNQVFYYRFQDNDRKTAIGQAKFTELKTYVKDIHFNYDDSFDSTILCAAKVMVAPSMNVVDLCKTPIKLYASFEDAVNSNRAIFFPIVTISFLQAYDNFVPFCLQDVWDTLDERLDLANVGNNYYQPIGYKWDGVKAKQTPTNRVVFDILNCQCLPCNLDGFYYSEKACKEDNAVKCYTF